MKQRFYPYRRRGTFYLQDSRMGKQRSLETRDRKMALRILEIQRQTAADPAYNQFVLKTCLATRDPLLAVRTWAAVMEQIKQHGMASTQLRYARAMKSKAFDALRHLKLIETSAEDFLVILKDAKRSVAHFLKRLHNLALGLGWLALPVLPPKLWPKLRFKTQRGITLHEHERILAVEKNPERNLYYQLLWEIGASQSDAASLTVENIDWATNTLHYSRMKTGQRAQMSIGRALATILKNLSASGPLFPKISQTGSEDRSAEFYRRCKLLGLEGVSLHSYRYAWAERAKTCGYVTHQILSDDREPATAALACLQQDVTPLMREAHLPRLPSADMP
jgi:integrase